MHRIDVSSATTDHKFTEGSPTGGVPATTVSADWLNDVQENIAKAIELAGITLVKGDYTQLYQAISGLSLNAGFILPFGATGTPTGWLKCNGAAVSRTAYAKLFAAISTLYGAGDGSTTFNLPDTRGLFLRALDEGKGLDPGRSVAGVQQGTLTMMDRSDGVGVQTIRSPSSAADVASTFGADATTVSAYPNAAEAGITATASALSTNSVIGTVRPTNMAFPMLIKY